MPKRVRDYERDLIEKLKDAEFAAEYLNASLEDVDERADEPFLIALRQVAQSHGMTSVAEKSGMARQAMYRALSESGNPGLSTLKALLDAMGLKLAVERKKRAS
ncbi:MAG: addiction module antidote protein [Bdellovibrionota bacterium]